MLGSLTGKISGRLGQRLLIDVNGVGYWVFTGSWQPEGEATCYLYHAIREDASDLFGFPDLSTLDFFEKLISISGIGPKAALAVLSLGPIDRLQQAILSQDTAYLSSAPGIGQKAAQKIILELQSKVALLPQGISNEYLDVLTALEGLGYRTNEAQKALQDLPKGLSIDEQLKWALTHL
jgi:Holliday junction DNA helicase RuvA